MSQKATHGAVGCQEPKDTFPNCCQGMAENMASFGPVMERMIARCMEKIGRKAPSGDDKEPAGE